MGAGDTKFHVTPERAKRAPGTSLPRISTDDEGGGNGGTAHTHIYDRRTYVAPHQAHMQHTPKLNHATPPRPTTPKPYATSTTPTLLHLTPHSYLDTPLHMSHQMHLAQSQHQQYQQQWHSTILGKLQDASRPRNQVLGCMCIHVCMIYISTHMHMHTHICTHAYTHIRTHLHTYAHAYARIHTSTDVASVCASEHEICRSCSEVDPHLHFCHNTCQSTQDVFEVLCENGMKWFKGVAGKLLCVYGSSRPVALQVPHGGVYVYVCVFLCICVCVYVYVYIIMLGGVCVDEL